MGKVTFTASIEFSNESEVQLATELVRAIREITSQFDQDCRFGAGAPAGKEDSKDEAAGEVGIRPLANSPGKGAKQMQAAPSAAAALSKPAEEISILAVVRRLGNAEGRTETVLDLQRFLDRKGDEGFKEFFETFMGVVFHEDVSMRPQTPEPYLEALLLLSDSWMDRIKKELTPRMLKFLTIKRPIKHPRADIAAYAEAFAVLVKHKVVAAAGAVKTMALLLSNIENRGVAAAMLHRTALHSPELPKHAAIDELREAFQQVTEAELREDVLCVSSIYGWLPGVVKRSPPGIEEIVSSKQDFKVSPLSSKRDSHQGAIFSLTVDHALDHLITTAKDGSVLAQDAVGKQIFSTTLDKYYACAADICQSSRLFLCGVTREAGAAPCIAVCSRTHANGAWSWRVDGQILRPNMKIVTCVKAFGPPDKGSMFATGEQMAAAGPGRRDCVCVYDIGQKSFQPITPTVNNRSCLVNRSQLSTLAPVSMYRQHDDIVTCLSAHPTNTALVFSGSKDCTIRCWDFRVPDTSVATLGGPNVSVEAKGHSAMITCVDTCGHSVISAGLDHQIMVWDVRQLKQPVCPTQRLPLDNHAILKISAVEGSSGGMLVAVSTVKGLFVLRAGDGQVAKAGLFPSRPSFNAYHDLKWTSAGLWAAGEDKSIDLFDVSPV